MRIFEGKTIDRVYKRLLTQLKSAEVVGNTKEITNCTLIVHNPYCSSIHFPERKISEKYSNAELEWYWTGDNSCETIGKSAKRWLEITDDGKTNNSAYGYILFEKYKNQLEEIISLLKKDPTSRRAVLNISDPTIDRINTKDMQCTIALQFLIRRNRVSMTTYMRSNDVFYGLPYDYIFFISLQFYVARRLKLKVGMYCHNATSMHLYLKDEEKLVAHTQLTELHFYDFWKKYEEKYLEEK